MAHELGHVLFREELNGSLSNEALYNRLFRAFERDGKYKSYIDLYGKELGFEEWYADNVTKWAGKRYVKRQARSLTDRHFKTVANRLRKLYRALSQNVRTRFGRKLDQDFETYIDAVVETKKLTPQFAQGSSFVRKALVQEVKKVIVKKDGEALAAHWRKSINDLKYNKRVKPILKILMTADGVMRMYAGNEIADMFYVRSQQGGKDGRLGMVAQAARKVDEFQNDFEKIVGRFDDPAVQAALEEAASSVETSKLSPLAQKVRQFLDKTVYDDYIAPSKHRHWEARKLLPVKAELLSDSRQS